jgi:molybdenum cofactor guanylyltransferase
MIWLNKARSEVAESLGNSHSEGEEAIPLSCDVAAQAPLVLLLAGGDGSRIGGGKPLRRLGARSLIEHALAAARSWSDALAISLREPGQLGQLPAPVIVDAPELGGPLGGLAAGLAHAAQTGRETLLTIPCDMPFLPPDLALRLAGAIGSKQAALAASGGRLHPVCGLWRTEARDLLPVYVATGRRSLNGLAEHVGFEAVEWPGTPDPFFNVNSAEDLAAAELRMRR